MNIADREIVSQSVTGSSSSRPGQVEETDEETRKYIIYKKPRKTFGVDIVAQSDDGNMSSKMKKINEQYIEVLIGEKPIRPLPTYKKEQLLEMSKRVGIAVDEKKKKEEIYNSLWEYMKWD